MAQIHPSYDITTRTWFLTLKSGSHIEAATIRDLLKKLPAGTTALGYYPHGTPRDLLPRGLQKGDADDPPKFKSSTEYLVDVVDRLEKAKEARLSRKLGRAPKEPEPRPGRPRRLGGPSQEQKRAAMKPDHLPGKDRDEAVMAMWWGMSASAIAEQLRISKGSVISIVQRMRRKGDPRAAAGDKVKATWAVQQS